ncbi:MAG: hypothetical protein M1835_002686 [Candelina submexicana]|nr:MAG: hypothetical protein M1835_002686 [Candelina submexicana]
MSDVEPEFEREEGVYHPADEWEFSRGEYHPADKTRNASLSRFPRRTNAPHRPSPLRIVTSSLDLMSDPPAGPPSPDTPALSPRFSEGTPAFQEFLDKQRASVEDEDQEDEQPGDSPDDKGTEENELTHYEDEGEDDGEAGDASSGRDNPFSPSGNLDDRLSSGHVPSVLSVIHEEEEVQNDYTVESPTTSPTSFSNGYSNHDEGGESESFTPSRIGSLPPVPATSPVADTPRRPIPPPSLDAANIDNSTIQFPIPPITPALKLQQERRAIVSFNRSLSIVLENGVEQVTNNALRDIIEPAAWELTASQILKALRQHLPDIAALQRDRLARIASYAQLSMGFDKMRDQMARLVGGEDVLREMEDLRLQLDENEGELEHLEKQLSVERRALSSKQEDCAEHLDELRYLQSELQDTALELKTLKRRDEIATSRRDGLFEELDSLESEDLRKRHSELVTALVRSRDELKTLKKQADFRGTEHALLQEELEDTKEGLAEARQVNEARAENENTLLTELEEIKRQLEIARDNERAAIERNKSLDTLAKDTIANMGTVETHVQQMETELEETKKRLAESKQAEFEAECENETLQEVLNGAWSKLASTRDQLEEVTETLERERRQDKEELDHFAEQLEIVRLLSYGGMV